jgi:hypothetical protein
VNQSGDAHDVRAAIERAGHRADAVFVGRQLDADVGALVVRPESAGEPAIGRARTLGNATGIDIKTIYRTALV